MRRGTALMAIEHSDAMARIKRALIVLVDVRMACDLNRVDMGARIRIGAGQMVDSILARQIMMFVHGRADAAAPMARAGRHGHVPDFGILDRHISPFAPSISHFLNFKLPVERST